MIKGIPPSAGKGRDMNGKVSSKAGILLRAIVVTVFFISFSSWDYAFADVLSDWTFGDRASSN